MKKQIKCLLAAFCIVAIAGCAADYDSDGGLSYMGLVNSITSEDNSGDKFSDFADNPFISCKEQNVSTFSVDADGASYAIMRKYVSGGWKIPASAVRIEEFLNYFTFDYAEPQDGNTVAINAEVAACPWNAQHKLLRLGIKGKSLSEAEMPKSNYVFLIDVSGSMDSDDKLPLLKKGLLAMLPELLPDDRISIITYSGHVEKLLESTPVNDISKISKAIQKLSASGSTAGGQALVDAYNEALANYIIGGNNRVIMGTDGDFNVGVTNTDELLKIVEQYADKGIFMTVCGFGSGNLNDAMMETISNRGNGTYEYIDGENQMMKVFVHERGKLISVACDSKCQITFNPDVVDSYRLIGYENRVMDAEDFDNDAKDAGEIGAGQTITALYEVVMANPTAQAKLATFDFRYKKSLNDESIPLTLDITDNQTESAVSENFNFAAGVAAYGMLLRKSPYKGETTFEMAESLISNSLSFDPHGYRAELLKIIKKSEDLNK